MKTSRIIFFFLTFSSLLIGCSNQENIVVGYLGPCATRDRFVNEGKFMEERFRELGHEMITLHADDNDALQLQQGFELLDRGVDVLIIAAVNGNTIAPLVREAHNRGVKVIAYNRLINNVEYDLFVTGNNADIARLFVEAAISRAPRGNYLVFAGDRFDRNGFEVKHHIDSLLAPHISAGRINLIYSSYVEGWSGDRAKFKLQQIIEAHGTDIDAIIACNDPMSLGSVEVLKNHGLAAGQVVITGQDAILETVRSIYRGEQTMTVYHPHRALGHKVADLVHQMFDGRDATDLAGSSTFNGLTSIPTYQALSMAITRENLQELVDLGEYTWEEIRN